MFSYNVQEFHFQVITHVSSKMALVGTDNLKVTYKGS